MTPVDFAHDSASRPEEPRRIDFDFKGDARTYFGIWIVNLLLTIVTLGIYSAWAKVRRLRYFYAFTYLEGHNFDYHARPVKILIGRLVVIGAVALYQILVALHPGFALLLVPYLLLLPWLINKSLAFNARMTSHRNLRFGFAGGYGRAFVVFLLYPLLAVVTLGLTIPLLTRARWRYVADNLTYGNARFSADPALAALYANFGASVLMGIGGVIGGSLVFGGLGVLVAHGTFSVWHVVPLMFYVGLGLGALFYRAGARNLAVSSMTLEGGHRFISTLERSRYVWIAISNVFVTVATLGLMRPWAAVRSWRYTTLCTSMIAASPLDDFVGRMSAAGNVVAAEFADLEGIDLGL